MRFNRSANYQKIFNIDLGKSKFNGQPVYYRERLGFGVIVIGGNTRYGKSIVASNMMAEIGQFRPVIVIDYVGEHFNRKFPNFLSADRNSKSLGLLIQIKGVKFHISQFDKVGDWLSLGFSDHSAQIMKQMVKHKDAYKNDPEIFMQMLIDVPVQGEWGKSTKFYNTWGFEIPMMHPAAMANARTHLSWLVNNNFFAHPEKPLMNFGELALEKEYIDINFDLDKSDISKARALCGKILEQIKEVLKKFRVPPLIVIEEADVLLPQEVDSSVTTITSVKIASEFVLKLQKFGVEIMFIVQDLKRLARSVWENYHILILGQMPPGNIFEESTKQLRWDYDLNYREFFVKGKDGQNYDVIVPLDSSTIY